MSVKSWKKEFYGPISRSTGSWLKACEHSLRKWEGVTKANLNKHDLESVKGQGIFEKTTDEEHDPWNDPHIEFNDDNCALCQRADKLIGKNTGTLYVHRCSVCPLVAVQGGLDCTDIYSPFDEYYETGNPTRMISALRRLHKKLSKTK